MNKNILRSLIVFVLVISVVSASAETINKTESNKNHYALNNKVFINRMDILFSEHELIQIEKNDTNIVFSSQNENTNEVETEKKTEKTKNQKKHNKKTQNKKENKKDIYFELSEEERIIVECIVMGEAGNESYKGQVLVAQCILNACIKDNLKPSVVRNKYKYSGWKTNPNDSVKKAVKEVFDNGYKVTNEFILYFYAPKYCTSNWHESQRYVLTEGGHRFFAEN